MGTLSGQRVKDAFGSLLKMESGTATSTTKIIEDGAGNDTALKLSTVKVEVNGILGFTSAPSTGSTEVQALFLDASNNVIKRNLGTAAFTSGATLTPVAPLNISSNIISISAPTTLAQLTKTTVALADTFLIYDATATVYKYITVDDLTQYLSLTITTPVAGLNGQVIYNNGGVYGGSPSVVFNDSPGAEQLNFMGLDFVQREVSNGTCAFFGRSDSAVVNNAVTNAIVTTLEADLFAGGLIVDYMIYGSGGALARVGEIHAVWNPNDLSIPPVMIDSIKVSFGSSTASTFVFNTSINVTTFRLRATNTIGENMTVLLNFKAFYAF